MTTNLKRGLTMVLAAALVVPVMARADDDDEREEHHRGHQGRREGREHQEGSREGGRGGGSPGAVRATPQWATYTAECGSCHMAFPPSMLPASSWKALMNGLANHFGESAELDAPTRTGLETWLTQNAGREVGGAPLRITSLGWWRREHDELDPSVYQRKAVASPANCGACHPGANEGAFGEHQVKIPRDAPLAR
jgi:hypothetical protein